jgi:hypothetical protein
MERQGESGDRSIGATLNATLKATYRALLARGLEAGEAANLTAFLHGLPSDSFHWTLPEIEGVLLRRIQHATEVRAAQRAAAVPVPRRGRSSIHDRRGNRTGTTHVIDTPKT